MPTATKAARNGAAAFSPTGTVAGDIVTRSVAAVTSMLRSAAGKARELSNGFAAEVRKVDGPTVNAYQQTGHLGDPTRRCWAVTR